MAFGTGSSNLEMAKPHIGTCPTTVAAPPAPLPTSTVQYNPPESTDQTVFVSPHAEYNIPVIALHTCKHSIVLCLLINTHILCRNNNIF